MFIDGLSFDDVLLVPKYSEISTRSSVDMRLYLPKNHRLTHPLIPANMATITGEKMAEKAVELGGMAIVHRFMPIEEQYSLAKKFVEKAKTDPRYNNIGFSVGVTPDSYIVVDQFAKIGVSILCIDIAHGHSKLAIDMTKYIAEKYNHIFLIAGNVATGDGAKALWRAGADVVKVGVGPGSLCTTRIETGNGVPQLTALMQANKARLELTGKWYHNGNKSIKEIDKPIFIIADGGIKNSGDCIKSLCFADMCMIGNVVSGLDENPGDIIEMNGHSYKSYVGSSTHKNTHVEGVKSLVPYKGKYENVLSKLLEGIRSGCSYQGISHYLDLQKDPQFVKISGAGMRESMPHDVMVIK